MAIKLAFIHAISSLHPGSGQGVGAIDLPVMRERATNLPLLPGSTIKGCLREAFHEAGDADEETLFGPPQGSGADFAGALRIGDARLLLLPVRSLGATFAWATSPYVLRRLKRDLDAAGLAPGVPAVTDVGDGQAIVASNDALVPVGPNNQRKLVLEEFDFSVANEAPDPSWASWISSRLFPGDTDWQAEMEKRFAIIDDKTFQHLAEFATEVQAHISIDRDTGTVDIGALWYQETLPAETVLVSLLEAGKPRNGSALTADQVLAKIGVRSDVQFGGKAGTGLGRVRLVPFGGA